MSPQSSQLLFGTEYEQELEIWLQRRFRYLCIAFVILGGVYLLIRFMSGAVPGETSRWLLSLAGPVISIGVALYYLTLRNWKAASRDLIIMHATRMILLLGATSILTQLILVWLGASFDGAQMLPRLLYWHVTACLFLPWTPRESLRPMIPLFVIWAICVIGSGLGVGFVTSVFTVIFGPGILLPGLGICSWRLTRHSQQFRREMVGRHFLSMRQELARARNIHESLFPSPYDDGHVRFDYMYLPMRELGGDFIHLHVGAEGLVHVSLIDVTGHGLAAALTVNRLFGELERIRGELPHAEPDEVLILLNRYIHLTMTKHNIYATAACMTIDPYLSELRWAAAGHPPGYLRRANGSVESLEATTVMLGALSDHDFTTDLNTQTIQPEDELVVYTDGVIESRNRVGQQYGLKRLQELMHRRPPPRNWPQFITSTIQKYSAGRSEDDVLVAALRFLAPRIDEQLTDEAELPDTSMTMLRVDEELS